MCYFQADSMLDNVHLNDIRNLEEKGDLERQFHLKEQEERRVDEFDDSRATRSGTSKYYNIFN